MLRVPDQAPDERGEAGPRRPHHPLLQDDQPLKQRRQTSPGLRESLLGQGGRFDWRVASGGASQASTSHARQRNQGKELCRQVQVNYHYIIC